MRCRNKIALGVCGLAAVALMSGCVMGGYGYGFGGVAVEGPPPAGVALYPDYYVWDGYEYVGVIGGQYYYLGPRDVWEACEPFQVRRFHEWERDHPDWHEHAIPNERYRPAYREPDHERGHDHDRRGDHERDHDHGDEH